MTSLKEIRNLFDANLLQDIDRIAESSEGNKLPFNVSKCVCPTVTCKKNSISSEYYRKTTFSPLFYVYQHTQISIIITFVSENNER